MMLIALALMSGSAPSATEAALRLCRPALARKAGGEIQTISVSTSRTFKHGVSLDGQLTVFVGMGPPAPGSASAHHLIRADFDFRCRTFHGRLVQDSVTPRQ